VVIVKVVGRYSDKHDGPDNHQKGGKRTCEKDYTRRGNIERKKETLVEIGFLAGFGRLGRGVEWNVVEIHDRMRRIVVGYSFVHIIVLDNHIVWGKRSRHDFYYSTNLLACY